MAGGALDYESDGYVPTWNRGQLVQDFVEKNGVIGCGIKIKWAFFGVNFHKCGVIRCKFCQIWVKIRLFQLKIDKIFEMPAKREIFGILGRKFEKKGGSGCWLLWKTGSLGVRFAKKEDHNTGRWYRTTYGSAPSPAQTIEMQLIDVTMIIIWMIYIQRT